jgi:hypothetical protein
MAGDQIWALRKSTTDQLFATKSVDREAPTRCHAGYRTQPVDTFINGVIKLRSLMRQPRIKGQGQSFYHCVSRVVDGRFLFQTQSSGSVEAEYFVHLMRRLENACRVQVLT